MFDHRNFAALCHSADQAFAAARHAQIHVLSQREQRRDRLAIRRGHHLDGVFGKLRIRLARCLNHRASDDLIGVQCLLATAQDRGVAGFETKTCRVRRHVGARFIDDDHHTDGRGNLLQLQTVRARAFIQNATHRIVQCRDFAQSLRHRCDALIIQLEPVQHRCGQTCRRTEIHVQRICLLDRITIRLQRVRHHQQTSVLFRSGQTDECARCRLGLLRQLRHLFSHIHGKRLALYRTEKKWNPRRIAGKSLPSISERGVGFRIKSASGFRLGFRFVHYFNP